MKTRITKALLLIGILTFACFSVASESYTSGSVDPSAVGIGAQSLGMGKTGVGLDGVNPLLNPAGIAGGSNALKIRSMYTSLLGGDINYLMLGGTIPTDFGLIGLTYIAGNAGEISLRAENTGADLGESSYTNSTIILTTGAKASEITLLDWLDLPLHKDCLFLGANLKLFSQTASDVSEFQGNGQDLDLGAIYQVNDKLTLGLNLQNVLPQSLGGNMHWVTNEDYGVPLNTKLGVTYKYNDKLLLAGDVDLRDGMTPLHLGGEYLLNSLYSVRIGIDQSVKPNDEIISDLTMGLGLNYKGFQANYAYHPSALESNNAYHYFSVTYLGDKVASKQAHRAKKPMVKTPRVEKIDPIKVEPPKSYTKGVGFRPARRSDIHVIQPAALAKVYDNEINVRLLVKSDINNLSVNGIPVKAVRGGIVGTTVSLDYGKQSIEIIYERDGQKYKAEGKVLRLPRFADVTEKRWSKDVVEHMSALGLYWGDNLPRYYGPKAKMTVRDLGEIVAKYKQIKTGATVDIDQATYDIIGLGIEIGYPGGLTPRTIVNRALACSVITKLGGIPILKVRRSPFADVAPGKWYTDRVMAAKNAGWVSGVKSKGRYYFFPGDSVTRESFITLLRPLLNSEINNLKL